MKKKLIYVNHVCPVPECKVPCPQFMCPDCWKCVASFERGELFAELKELARRGTKKPTPKLQYLFNRAYQQVLAARGEFFRQKALPKVEI